MISVLLATYNGHRFIQKSIDSVLNQTFGELELLIGLNGENSKTKEILEKYNDPRIKIFDYGDDKGKAKTLNKLLMECSFEILCLQDDDDIWQKNKLEKQISFIDENDVVGTFIQYINERGEIIGYPELSLFHDRIVLKSLSGDNQIANTSAMFRKKDSIRVGGWEETKEGIEDFHFWIKLIREKKTFLNIPEFLVQHRIHSTSNFNTKKYDLNWIKNAY